MTALAHSGPRPRRLLILALIFLRGRIRASELWLVAIAAGVGAVAGLATLATSFSARYIQRGLFGLSHTERLSSSLDLNPWYLLALPVGGLILGVITRLWTRRRPRPIVDAVEANALRGGRMSLSDSLFLGLQSVISNGFGASVGLEAAYAQLGAVVASATGGILNLRRSDLRTFVGAGAGAGIATAFGAPLTGAFYAFEIIIGSYTVANIAPVVAAALAGALIAKVFDVDAMVIRASVTDTLTLTHYLIFAGLGIVCALFGIAVMRLVALTEKSVSRLPVPSWTRPALGGVLLALIALKAPQTLSAGHGAMRMDFGLELAAGTLALLVLSKAAASIVALGFGFRGGLFFASLYLGSLVGRLFILTLYAAGLEIGIDPMAGALVGMGAMAVAIIGGPFTMTFLVLETTGDFALTAATLTASIVASVLVREVFGYSFSTWRLHLRGETIRSAHDVGWLRTLTAGRMMRTGASACPGSMTVEDFRGQFPLGSTRRVVALDAEGRYAGIIRVADVYAENDYDGPVIKFAFNTDQRLTPDMTVKDIMSLFDRTETDELAVVDHEGRLMGIVSEAYATRRYAEESERARHELVGID